MNISSVGKSHMRQSADPSYLTQAKAPQHDENVDKLPAEGRISSEWKSSDSNRENNEDKSAVTAKLHRAVSLSEQAYHALKKMIIQLELAPGLNFSENELAEKLGISRSPVRAALARLQEDGFIETSGRVGLKTVDVDAGYVRNIYEIRAVLEGLCARKSAKLISDEEIDRLATAKDSVEVALRSGDSEEWDLLEPKFHEVIVDLCDNDMLKALLHRMRDHWDRIRNVHGHTIADAWPSP